jgi:hypothetical protein
MKFKDLPVKDKNILEGREPLPEEASYLMDKYIGTDTSQKYNKDTKLVEKYRMDMYAPMKQSELEARKWGRVLTDVFDVNPKTLEMTPKEGISQENSKRYFEMIKRNLTKYSDTDDPLTNRIRGAVSKNENRSLSSTGLQYIPETGELEKSYIVRGADDIKSLLNVLSKDEATAEFSQLSPYYKLLQSVKEKYKSIQDPEIRTKLETEELSRQINKDENTRMQMEEFKKNQQKVLDLYKEHIKNFGEKA